MLTTIKDFLLAKLTNFLAKLKTKRFLVVLLIALLFTCMVLMVTVLLVSFTPFAKFVIGLVLMFGSVPVLEKVMPDSFNI